MRNRKPKDIANQKFGMVTAISFYEMRNNFAYWKCKCECGKEFVTRGSSLRRGEVNSCGCITVERMKNNPPSLKHGLEGTHLYSVWLCMKRRCYNLKNKDYLYYGGRGIVICDEWKKNFISFYNWSMENGYKDNLTIDRINTNGNYEPSNCRWVTMKEQSQNRNPRHTFKKDRTRNYKPKDKS